MRAASLEPSGILDGATGSSTFHAQHSTWGRLGVLVVFLGICLERGGWNQWENADDIRQEPGSARRGAGNAIPGGEERFWFLLTRCVRPAPQKSTCPAGTGDSSEISSSGITHENTFCTDSSVCQPAEHGEKEISFHREWFPASQ